jgi:glycosyltransferase involved in cell wall biosynthesis
MDPVMSTPEISIVIPMYNESGNLESLFAQITEVMGGITREYELVCVNDGSSDDTLDQLLRHRERDPRIVVIDLARNFGKDIALSAGLEYSRGEAVIPMDADLQDPPDLIADFVAKWREGYEVVYAQRRTRQGETAFKLASANLFYKVLNRLSDTPIPPNTGDFRLMDRRVVDALCRLPERTRFMKGLFAWVGFRQTAIRFDREPRLAGRSKWNYLKLWRFALDGIASFSTTPLKIWGYLGGVIAFCSFLYLLFLLGRTLLHGTDVPGYASLMVVVLFLGGIQLLGIGILGEYVGRIFTETKQRPLYLVRSLYRDEVGD